MYGTAANGYSKIFIELKLLVVIEMSLFKQNKSTCNWFSQITFKTFFFFLLSWHLELDLISMNQRGHAELICQQQIYHFSLWKELMLWIIRKMLSKVDLILDLLALG